MAGSVGILSCIVATPLAWLVARTDMPGRRFIRGLVTASFVTPPFLGAIAWEMLAAPNSGMLNEVYRWVFGLERSDHLFNIFSFTGLVFCITCYSFPFVFTLVANAFDKVPSNLEEASSILGAKPATTLWRITLPMVLPAILAGALVAIVEALTTFGSPAILALPAGFHVITTKIWSFFQFPPHLNLGCGECAAAADRDGSAVAGTEMAARPPWLYGGRRQERRAAAVDARPLEMAGWAYVGLILCLTIIFPYAALLKTALTHNISEPLTWQTLTLHNFEFVLFEFSATRLAIWNTLILGLMTATIASAIVVARRLSGSAAISALAAFSGCLRRCRSLFPASCLASDCSSLIPVRCSGFTARSGSC